MQGTDKPNFRPFIPLIKYSSEKGKPYICRLAPSERGFCGEWLNPDESKEYHLCCGEVSGKINKVKLSESTFEISGLKPDTDYEIYIESEFSRSEKRLLRTGTPPANMTVVNYLHPEDRQYIFSGKYLCSPSITGLQNGMLFASCDVFGSNMPQNLTLLFSSADKGETWNYVCDIIGFFWGLLFSRENELYLLGLSTEYGSLKITKSTDNGKNWCTPVTLFNGSDRSCLYGGLHRAPMPFTEYAGRLYTSIEYGSWQSGGHLPGVLYIDKDCDYMCSENWNITDFLPFEGKWSDDCNGQRKDGIEGNIVINPEGSLENILRWDKEKALVLKVTEKGLQYSEIRSMPVSDSMFRIVMYKGRYLLVSNRRPENFDDSLGSFRRNIISLFVSDDLKNWRLVKDIINFGDKDMMKYGFQYPSAFLEGDTLYLLIRSSYNGAAGYHDSNTILFTKTDLTEAEIDFE